MNKIFISYRKLDRLSSNYCQCRWRHPNLLLNFFSSSLSLLLTGIKLHLVLVSILKSAARNFSYLVFYRSKSSNLFAPYRRTTPCYSTPRLCFRGPNSVSPWRSQTQNVSAQRITFQYYTKRTLNQSVTPKTQKAKVSKMYFFHIAILTLSYTGGGTLCPDAQSISCGSQVEASNLLQFSEFVPCNLRQALVESFLEFFLKTSKNMTSKIFGRPQL